MPRKAEHKEQTIDTTLRVDPAILDQIAIPASLGDGLDKTQEEVLRNLASALYPLVPLSKRGSKALREQAKPIYDCANIAEMQLSLLAAGGEAVAERFQTAQSFLQMDNTKAALHLPMSGADLDQIRQTSYSLIEATRQQFLYAYPVEHEGRKLDNPLNKQPAYLEHIGTTTYLGGISAYLLALMGRKGEGVWMSANELLSNFSDLNTHLATIESLEKAKKRMGKTDHLHPNAEIKRVGYKFPPKRAAKEPLPIERINKALERLVAVSKYENYALVYNPATDKYAIFENKQKKFGQPALAFPPEELEDYSFDDYEDDDDNDDNDDNDESTPPPSLGHLVDVLEAQMKRGSKTTSSSPAREKRQNKKPEVSRQDDDFGIIDGDTDFPEEDSDEYPENQDPDSNEGKYKPQKTESDSASLTRYMAIASKTPLLSREEERILAEHIEEGDERAKAHMIRANLRLVISIAKHYQNHGLSFIDLIQEGNIGLMKAVGKFDWRFGNKFSTYAIWWIRQAITRGLGDKSREIRIPINTVDRIRKLALTVKDLRRDNIDVTPETIAERMGLPIEEVKILMEASRVNQTIHYDTLGAKNENGEDTHGDEIYGETDPEFENIEHQDALNRFWKAVRQIVRASDIKDKERSIYIFRRCNKEEPKGKDKDYSQEDVGAELGITRERVRQLLETIKTLLKGSNIREIMSAEFPGEF
jgi:RNA polymerase primary sigma factor